MRKCSALNESHVSDSDAQSAMGGSQSVLILPSSYSFDQVRIMCTDVKVM